MMRRTLVVLTRYPEPGRTKTRLIPALGAEGAAALQREMTQHVVQQACDYADGRAASIEVHFEGGSRVLMQRWLGSDLTFVPQSDGDLGQRIHAAVTSAFQDKATSVVVIGADCPRLTPTQLGRAFDLLADNDVVLGPTEDGGYYLIGLSRPEKRLFEHISWGSERVFEQTRATVQTLGLSVGLLETLTDVDRSEDLESWEREKRRSARISVVIPALNEEAILAGTLVAARAGLNVELIVADGGSQDQTVELARQHGARVVETAPNRAVQMNAGAAVAEGQLLLFLHADTRLPSGYCRHVRTILACNGVVAGAFALAIDGAGFGLRTVAQVANWRSRWLAMPYGDQGIFLRRDTFERAGCYPVMPIMEDHALVRKLHSIGKVVTAPAAVVTSARRWHALGLVRVTLTNQLVLGAYFAGVTPERIKKLYGRRR